MSARIDPVGSTERQTLPIPYGHHVYVVSDLSLSPTTNVASRPVREFIDLLGDIDDAAVVIVAGNLFYPDATSDLAKFIDATLRALPAVAAYNYLQRRVTSLLSGAGVLTNLVLAYIADDARGPKQAPRLREVKEVGDGGA